MDNRIPKQLVKIAKSLVSGGGAGIVFTINGIEDGDIVAIRKGNKYKIKIKKMPQVDKFDAEGYMDGQQNVDGRLMKIVDLDFNEKEVTDSLVDNLESNYDSPDYWPNEVEISISDVDMKMTHSGGYIRSTMKKGDTLVFEDRKCRATIVSDWSIRNEDVQIGMTVEVTQKMEYWYQDVFEAEYDEEDDD